MYMYDVSQSTNLANECINLDFFSQVSWILQDQNLHNRHQILLPYASNVLWNKAYLFMYGIFGCSLYNVKGSYLCQSCKFPTI